ncbi:hypothetical protein CDCA_CDCA06G1756 [Cyanidium caldarium]|uniref:Uncharacterized protein n=1 Tax=Cyanidium caldarium TaxID=2771 RepID=A0AAV9IU87_CYACA|nr:hypothetical protein CDCA_CDCA06G1756 [Cyanidium caldarium]
MRGAERFKKSLPATLWRRRRGPVVAVPLALLLLIGCVLALWGLRNATRPFQQQQQQTDAMERIAPGGWLTGTDLVEQVRDALSIGTRGHCTVVLGLDERVRDPALARVLQWFAGERRLWHLRGVTRADVQKAAAETFLRNTTTITSSPRERGFVFSHPVPTTKIDAPVACSVSHLLALNWLLRHGCKTALVLEDDASLEALPLWDAPVAQVIREACTPAKPLLQMEVKLVSLLKGGYSGVMRLEDLTVNCSRRHLLQHRRHITYGTAAYGISAAGMRRVLQRFSLRPDSELIDATKVVQSGGHADVHVILNEQTTRVLWPAYFFEYGDAKSYITGERKKEYYMLSANKAIEANLERAALCHVFV